jgi:hypothetical protein
MNLISKIEKRKIKAYLPKRSIFFPMAALSYVQHKHMMGWCLKAGVIEWLDSGGCWIWMLLEHLL